MREKQAARFGDIHSTDPLNAAFSPDGRWVAYTERSSPRGGRIMVQPVPATGALYQVSPDGDTGHHPFWSPDGRELFYFGLGGGRMVSVPVTLGAEFSFGNMVPVKPELGSPMTSSGPLNYDITPDGRAFVWTKPVDSTGAASPGGTDHLRVVVNWFDELRVRVPVK